MQGISESANIPMIRIITCMSSHACVKLPGNALQFPNCENKVEKIYREALPGFLSSSSHTILLQYDISSSKMGGEFVFTPDSPVLRPSCKALPTVTPAASGNASTETRSPALSQQPQCGARFTRLAINSSQVFTDSLRHIAAS